MKKENIKAKENIENISIVIEEKKKIPKNIKDKISAKILENIIFSIVVTIYLSGLNLGMSNIPTENYLIDLKVFSMILLISTIILFEIAYKKDKSGLWLHGIEVMVIAVFTIYLIYLYSIYYNSFGSIVFSFAFIYIIYYAIKCFFMKRKIVIDYNKSLIDIGEIVKKDR